MVVGAAEPMRVVKAEEILEKIELGEPVEYNNVIVEEDLDLSGLALPRETVKLTEDMKILGIAEYEVIFIVSPIFIRNSIIKGSVNFNRIAFQNAIDFSGTRFEGVVYLSGSRFNQTANFREAEFNRIADFSEAQFKCRTQSEIMYYTLTRSITFQGAKFSKEANFWGAQFNQEVDFREAQFNQTAYFGRAQFNSEVDFRGAQFNQTAYFDKANFKRLADFSRAQFNKEFHYFSRQRILGETRKVMVINTYRTTFDWAKFTKEAVFSGAQFNQEVDFKEAQFNQTAYFSEAQFNQTASFGKAQFNQNATFAAAQFDQTANFRKAEFNQIVYFRYTQFNQVGDFRIAQFKQTADFSEAQFNQTALFAGAQFNQTADFRNAQLIQESHFQDAIFLNVFFNNSQFSKEAFFDGTKINGTLSLNRTKYDILNIRWSSIHDLAYEDTAYHLLIQNFNKLGFTDDARECQYSYRCKHRVDLFRKHKFDSWLFDLLAWASYGYGLRPVRPLGWAALFILMGGLFFFLTGSVSRSKENKEPREKKNADAGSSQNNPEGDVSIWEALLLSATYFTSGASSIISATPTEFVPLGRGRYVVVILRLLGWIFFVLFLSSLTRTV